MTVQPMSFREETIARIDHIKVVEQNRALTKRIETLEKHLTAARLRIQHVEALNEQTAFDRDRCEGLVRYLLSVLQPHFDEFELKMNKSVEDCRQKLQRASFGNERSYGDPDYPYDGAGSDT